MPESVKVLTEAQRIAEIRARASRATPGPWGWFGNTDSHQMFLGTRHSGRLFLLLPRRWGRNGGRFQFQGDGVMVDADTLARYEVLGGKTKAEAGLPPDADRTNSPLYRADLVGFDHPDAEFIEHAREDIETLLAELDRLRPVGNHLAQVAAQYFGLAVCAEGEEEEFQAAERVLVAALKSYREAVSE